MIMFVFKNNKIYQIIRLISEVPFPVQVETEHLQKNWLTQLHLEKQTLSDNNSIIF